MNTCGRGPARPGAAAEPLLIPSSGRHANLPIYKAHSLLSRLAGWRGCGAPRGQKQPSVTCPGTLLAQAPAHSRVPTV